MTLTRLKRAVRGLAVAFLVSAAPSIPLAAADPKPASWQDANHIEVTTTAPGVPGHFTVVLEVASNGDRRLQLSASDGTTVTNGKILLLAGRWLVIRDLTVEAGHEMDAADTAGLQVQMATALLDRAFPRGIRSVKGRQKVALGEAASPIVIGTIGYDAPWSLTGQVNGSGESATFELDFSFSAGSESPSVHLAGSAAHARKPLVLEDSESLAGWTVYTVGAYANAPGSVRKVERSFANIGELRAVWPGK